ncbi:hypothetical protein QQ008_20690 [Fulvivirgaceae bacterium BMA10]|uniref:Uncharacterized protein n=1 Tax=Splendidivirga corallicola TaxID=3051826 RepID=A0ABT8KSU9_9BACT|nr:hypothetical protein [Fulvivirgaceae bacterium BMA10]
MRFEDLDNIIRAKVNGLEGVPPNVEWRKEPAWDKIDARLQSESQGSKILGLVPLSKLSHFWQYSVAASVAIVIASSVWLGSSYFNDVDQLQKEDGHSASGQGYTDLKQDKNKIYENNLSSSNGPVDMEKILQDAISKDIETPQDRELLAQLAASGYAVNSIGYGHSQSSFTNVFHYSKAVPFNIEVHDQIDIVNYLTPHTIGKYSSPEYIRSFEVPTLPEMLPVSNETPNASLAFIINGGTGFVKDNFAPQLEAGVLLKLKNKLNQYNHTLSLKANTQYFKHQASENENSNNLNTFIVAEYGHNIAKKKDKPFWLGLGIGYMAQSSGDYFDKGTMMLDMILGGNDSSKIKITPQVYLTDNLTRVVPGIKVGLGLGKFEKGISI